MLHSITRAMLLAVAGALAGVLCLGTAYVLHPDLALEMDRDLPRLTSGFYPVERNGDETFAWTGRSAALRLTDIDRRLPWRCSVRARGGRPGGTEQPTLQLAVDGLTLASRTVTNEYEEVEVEVPARPSRSGAILTLTSSATHVPGASDSRELGVQLDRLVCRPDGNGLRVPPVRAIAAAAISGAAFGAAFGLTATLSSVAALATLLVAAAQAVPMSAGPAPYMPYETRAAWAALWIALVMALTALVIERWRRARLSSAAWFALAFSGAALFLELLALLHPLKAIIDAVFHAHRLEAVLAGHYFFTQRMPDGVQFPYAIALYVFAAPWAALTSDHVALLRIVVSAAHVVAGLLLYPMVVRSWDDRLAGAAAVLLYQLAPLPYIVIGNANLTYAFGQSAAVFALAAATMWPLRSRDLLPVAGLTVLASVAFLSHVGVFPLLLATLVFLAVLCWWLGGADGRRPARLIILAVILAAVFSVVSYYGRFGEAYSTLQRVRATASAPVPSPGAGATPGAQAAARAAGAPLHRRISRALGFGVTDAGWPIVLLAIVGAWQAWRIGGRDRLRLLLLAAALTYLVFLAFSVAAPVEPRFQRYTDEFISRLDFAMLPAVAALAAYGVASAWRAGRAARAAAAALLAVAAVIGVQHWAAWLA